jgi:tetratricopeptide (TPR) repeat protein
VALNSRAIGAKLAGDYEGALRQFYAALAAADETGLPGPRITALGNLGGYHQDLFNFDDARSLSEQALAEARAADMRAVVTVSTANLVFICHALGEMAAARALAASILERPDEQLPAARERFPLALALGHLAVGEHQEAMAYLGDRAVTAIADGDGVCDWTWILAQCLIARGDAAGARACASRPCWPSGRGAASPTSPTR